MDSLIVMQCLLLCLLWFVGKKCLLDLALNTLEYRATLVFAHRMTVQYEYRQIRCVFAHIAICSTAENESETFKLRVYLRDIYIYSAMDGHEIIKDEIKSFLTELERKERERKRATHYTSVRLQLRQMYQQTMMDIHSRVSVARFLIMARALDRSI